VGEVNSRRINSHRFLSKAKRMKSTFYWWCISAGLLTAAFQVPCVAQTPAPPRVQPNLPSQYSAVAFGQAGAAAGKSFGLTIYVEELTSDGQVEELVGVLKHKGQDGLLKAFEDMKDKGRVAPIGSTGTGMRFVRIRQTPNGGEHIVLVTDRPISFRELYQGTRSRDYAFGIVVLDVDMNGKGTGTFAPLCMIRFNKRNELEIEHYGQKPFRLANVRRQK
jgi:hypothetical protein